MGKYSSLAIHVFSGTGNSLRAAGWLGELFDIHKTKLVRIGKEKVSFSTPGADSITGVVFPTHGFTAPWAVLRHVLRLPRGKKSAAFVIATRAGAWPGFLLPGMSANAVFVVALILLLKGYHIKGLRGLDMPSNWMSLHWGISRKNAEKIIERAKIRIEQFGSKIFKGERYLLSFNNVIDLVVGICLMPLSAGYLLIGRFGLAKLFYANWKCNSCGQCAQDCPMGAIIMKGHKAKKPYWTFACESCMHCMGYCPQKAVEASHPMAIALYFITTFSVAGTLGTLLITLNPTAVPLGPIVLNHYIQMLFNYLYILFSFFLTYFLFYYLVRIPMVNRIFSCLTLTHYYRRYHEPGISRKDYVKNDIFKKQDKI
jgi:Pyruvate/2-oxoacid:ferredoxin oxidoreductase delta subunit